MWCPKCKEGDWDKLKVVDKEERIVTNYFTYDQWWVTELTIECQSCGYEFEEEI